MNISIILAHPRPGSFNHAMASAAKDALLSRGHQVTFHDLYQEEFPPVMPSEEIQKDGAVPELIQQHGEELKKAEGIVVVHPNWWGMPPAILAGWIDRVLRPGQAYRFIEGDQGEGVPEGLLKAWAALVFNTANTTPAREEKVFGDPLQSIWEKCIFDLCGVKTFHRVTFTVVVTSTPKQRREWLDQVAQTVVQYFP
ncbi:MAG: NAD(P)H-dependent oxidoreductase [Lentisphaerota bacterium]